MPVLSLPVRRAILFPFSSDLFSIVFSLQSTAPSVCLCLAIPRVLNLSVLLSPDRPSFCPVVTRQAFFLSCCHQTGLLSVLLSPDRPSVCPVVTRQAFFLSSCHQTGLLSVLLSPDRPSFCPVVIRQAFFLSSCHQTGLLSVLSPDRPSFCPVVTRQAAFLSRFLESNLGYFPPCAELQVCAFHAISRVMFFHSLPANLKTSPSLSISVVEAGYCSSLAREQCLAPPLS